MKKFIVPILEVIVILALVIIITYRNFYIDLEYKRETPVADEGVNKELTIIPMSEEMLKNNANNDSGGGIILYEYNRSDYKNLYKFSKYIIIGTVESIDGVVNYNPVTKDYVMARTIGKVKVEKTLKGNLDEEVIPFIRGGATLPLIEYEKELPKEQAEKMGYSKLPKAEKENRYIVDKLSGDITIEQGKTYLMFLDYAIDYDMYSIQFNEYGLREVKQENGMEINKLNSIEINNIKVKNNNTGEYEAIGKILTTFVKYEVEIKVAIIITLILLCIGLIRFTIINIKTNRGQEALLLYCKNTKDNEKNIKGNFLDINGNIYSYKIPKRAMKAFNIESINTKILNRYRRQEVCRIENEDILEMLNNIKLYFKLPYDKQLEIENLSTDKQLLVAMLNGDKRCMMYNKVENTISQENTNVLNILNKYNFFK